MTADAQDTFALTDAGSVEQLVDRARIDMLYQRAPIALATVVVNSALLAALLGGLFPWPALLGWLSALAIVTVARAALIVAYRRRVERLSVAAWERAFAVGALLNGVAWGVGTAAFIDTPLEYQVGVLFIVGGMVAGASSSSATSMLSFASYTVAAAVPVIGTLLAQATATHLILGSTSLIFVGAMGWMARQGGTVVVDAIRLKLHRDTLARELAERTRERAGRLQQLLDHAGVVTLVADPQTSMVIDASRNAVSVLGLSDRALVDRALIGTGRIEPFASAARWRRLVEAARKDGTTVTATASTDDERPRVRHLEISATIRAVAGVEYVLLVLKDVTDSRELEAQLSQAHLLAALGTLSAGVAHEINNPLASVLANLRLMKASVDLAGAEMGPDVDALLKPPLEDAVVGAERIRSTVANLLATTQAAGEAQAQTDPKQIIQMLLRVTDNELRHRAEVVFDARPTPTVRVDPLRLYQVFLPLVLQASRAIAHGDATRNRITVRLRNDPDTETVRIDIEDTGPEITAEEAARVFEPVHSMRDHGRGAGLGLSVCKRVVSELGGTIEASPARSRGTRFTVRLPAAPPADDVTDDVRPAAAPVIQPGLRILIVDDDVFVARALTRMMSDHRVVVETNPAAAIERLMTAAEGFDIVLCDMMMPDMSGMEFYESVSKQSSTAANKIVFMTGGAFTEAARDFLRTVGRPCLVKPFDLAALHSVIVEQRANPPHSDPSDPPRPTATAD